MSVRRGLLLATAAVLAACDSATGADAERVSSEDAAVAFGSLARVATEAGDTAAAAAYTNAWGVIVINGSQGTPITVDDNGVPTTYYAMGISGPATIVTAWSATRPLRLLWLGLPRDTATFATGRGRATHTTDLTTPGNPNRIGYTAVDGSAVLAPGDSGVPCPPSTMAWPSTCRLVMRTLQMDATLLHVPPVGRPVPGTPGASAATTLPPRRVRVTDARVPVTRITRDSTTPPSPPPTPGQPPLPPLWPVVPPTSTTLAAWLRVQSASADSVVLVFGWRNIGRDTVRMLFGTTQRFDLEARSPTASLWRWSADKAFGQVLGTEVLAPQGEREYRAVWPRPARGPLLVRGMSVNTSGARAELTIPLVVP